MGVAASCDGGSGSAGSALNLSGPIEKTKSRPDECAAAIDELLARIDAEAGSEFLNALAHDGALAQLSALFELHKEAPVVLLPAMRVLARLTACSSTWRSASSTCIRSAAHAVVAELDTNPLGAEFLRVVQGLALHGPLSAMLRSISGWPPLTHVLIDTLTAIAAHRSTDAANADAILRALEWLSDEVPYVGQGPRVCACLGVCASLLQRFPDDAAVARSAVSATAAVGIGGSGLKVVRDALATLTEPVIAAMVRHRDDSRVAAASFDAIALLAGMHQARESLKRHTAAAAVVAVWRRHMRDSSSCFFGLQCAGWLCSGDLGLVLCPQFVEAGGVEVVVSTLREYADDARITAAAIATCTILAGKALSTNNYDSAVLFPRLCAARLPAALVDAMSRHDSNADIVKDALQALGVMAKACACKLAQAERLGAAFDGVALMPQLESVWREHSADWLTVQPCIQLLSNLHRAFCRMRPELALNASWLQLIGGAIVLHSARATVARCALECWTAAADTSPCETWVEILSPASSLLPQVVAVLRGRGGGPGEWTVTAAWCDLCGTLAANAGGADALIRSGGVEVMVRHARLARGHMPVADAFAHAVWRVGAASEAALQHMLAIGAVPALSEFINMRVGKCESTGFSGDRTSHARRLGERYAAFIRDAVTCYTLFVAVPEGAAALRAGHYLETLLALRAVTSADGNRKNRRTDIGLPEIGADEQTRRCTVEAQDPWMQAAQQARTVASMLAWRRRRHLALSVKKRSTICGGVAAL